MKTAKKILEALLVLALLIASVAVYNFYLAPQTVQTVEAQAKSTYQTATVSRGDISNTASGSGTLVAAQTTNLGFTTDGTIIQLNVQAGDKVKAGQVLAVLDSIPSLTQAVANSQLALLTAQKALDDLTTNANGNLAKALADQAAAQAALVTAQNNLHDPHDWRCPDNVTAAYYKQYEDALVLSRYWQGFMSNAKPSEVPYYQSILKPILKKMDQAYQNYTYCQAYTPKEIIQSKADLQTAQANLQHAQLVYTNLQANHGIDPLDLAIAQANLKNAQIQLTTAQNNLAGATLTAPYDGTIYAVSSAVGSASGSTTVPAVGQPVGTNPVLTIAKTDQMQILGDIDETDLANIASGCQANIAFTALTGKSYPGTVSLIYPSLVTANNVKVVQVLIDLKPGALAGTSLPIGADANIQITCAQAQNAVLVPFQALYVAADGTTSVYVLNAQGQPEKRPVTLGIKTSISAEVKSGLKAGEKVITSPLNLP